MNKSNSRYIMNKFIIPVSVWNVLLEKAIKVFFNFLDSIRLILSRRDTKKITPAKASSIFEKNVSEY